MLFLGNVLIGVGLGGIISYCYIRLKVHSLTREVENQIKSVLRNDLRSK